MKVAYQKKSRQMLCDKKVSVDSETQQLTSIRLDFLNFRAYLTIELHWSDRKFNRKDTKNYHYKSSDVCTFICHQSHSILTRILFIALATFHEVSWNFTCQ